MAERPHIFFVFAAETTFMQQAKQTQARPLAARYEGKGAEVNAAADATRHPAIQRNMKARPNLGGSLMRWLTPNEGGVRSAFARSLMGRSDEFR